MSGQPDKVCDQIADALVDEFLRRDPQARVDLQVLGSHGMLMVGGEATSSADFDCSELAKRVYRDIGYADEIEVFVNIDKQSEEMQRAPLGATDSVVVYGYATRETREFLPLPLVYAHNIARRLDDLRGMDPAFSWMGPDGKVQIVAEGGKVASVTLLVSHDPSIHPKEVQTAVLDRVVAPILGEDGMQIFINPLGSFTASGFAADSGVNGRKTAVDTYGGLIPNADGALSGKDPMSVRRSGTYMARFVAKDLVAQGLADAVMVTAAYTLGRSKPVKLSVRAMGPKSRGTKTDFTNLVAERYDFRPEAIVERLKLRQPIYRSTAVYGHFGKAGLPWEETEARGPAVPAESK